MAYKLTTIEQDEDGETAPNKMCPACRGSGWVPIMAITCIHCKGAGTGLTIIETVIEST